MAERIQWADRYASGRQTSAIGTAAATDIGYPLNNHPSFNPGQNIIDTRKATGLSYRHAGTGFEFQQGTKEPTTTWEFHVTPRMLAVQMWGLTQQSATEETGSPYVKYFIPYSTGQAAIEMWQSLVRSMAPSGTASSHRIVGAVPSSITLSAEEGTPLTASVDFRGYNFESNRDVASDTLTVSAENPLLWQNATISLGGTTVNLPGFTMTITNNLITKWYDSQTVEKFLLGDFGVEGTITVPWAATTVGGNQQITDFINGNVTRLVIYWGTGGAIATTSQDLSIITHIRRTGAETVAEDEIGIQIPFVGVSGSRSTAGTVAWTLNSATITGTSTAFDSYNVGDLFRAAGAATAANRVQRIIKTKSSDTSMTVFPAMTTAESGISYYIDQTPLSMTMAHSGTLIS